MNKKTKWAIPFAVLALTCGIAAGCGGGHEHSYTSWGYNETQHWKECPDDGTKDDSTVANHGTPNADGKCPDCGYQLADPHVHTYTQWGSSMTHHWKECPDDGEIDAATKEPHGTPDAEGKCPDCGYQLVTYINQACKLVLRKDGNNTNLTSLEGISVKLSQSGKELVENTDYTIEKGQSGALTIKGIVSGTYTVTILTADGQYRYSNAIKLDGSGEKEIVLQYNYAIATAQSYYVDLTHMNDTDRLLAIKTSSVDGFWQWNQAVSEITLTLDETVQESKNVKLEFHLKAEKPNNQPNNAFGIVMTETYKGVALSIWDTENENDGVKLYNLVGQKLGYDAYSADGNATLKWLETAIYSDNGVDIRVVRANHTLTYYAKDANGKWIAIKSLACPEDAKTEIKFMGAGSDYTITNIEVDDAYTEAAKSYSGTLTVLNDQDEKVALAEGAKGLLIAGDTKYEVELTKNDDGTYAFSDEFVPGLYTFSILGNINGYTSATVQLGEAAENVQIKLGAYATATVHEGDGIQLADRVTISDGNISIEGYHSNGFWQWRTGGQSSNVVPAATLNLSDEVKSSRNVVVDFKLKATNPNNLPNNAFGIAMTEFHNGVSMSFWDTTTETDGIALYDLKGTWLGEDGWGDDKAGTLKWLETAIYDNGAYIRAERNGASLKFYARQDNEWVLFYETECYEYAETMIKFLGIGSNFEISGIKVSIPKEGEVNEYNVTASVDGNAHGYTVTVDPTVEEGGSATLEIITSDANAAWSYFPNAITVNGTAVDFSTVQVESLGANRCKYTLVISGISENTNVVVTVGKGTQVGYSASVNDAEMGSLVCDMENYGKEYYWNDACGLTLTANEGYRLKSIVIGEGDGAQTITEGWTKDGLVYSYTFTVTGDIKIAATYEINPEINLSGVTISVVDKENAAVTLAEGETLVLLGDYEYEIVLTAKEGGGYTATGSVQYGVYNWYLSDTKLGYVSATLEVNAETNAITLQLGDIATATEYHHGDHNGMGECDFETLIDIDSTTIKINTAVANDKVVDGFWCWNSEVPEVTLNISEEVKNATNVTVEFNLKVANGNNNPNNAFGIAIAGYKGVAISLWNINDNKIDLHELTGCKLGADGWGYADTYASYGWVETLAESADGVNLRAVRDGASIQFYAQNADGEWVKFFETTCDESAKTDVKFLGMGSDYTISNVKLSTTQEAAPAIATATEYHHGDHNGMGECDFETLIDIDSTTIKINTAVANDKVVDGFWCWNSEVPEVTLNISEEVKNATNVTIEFNLKVANGNNNPNNAFGIAIAGYKGVAISLWNINDNKIDLHELTGCKLGADGWGYADTYASYGWVETLAESADGVNLRAVRDGASIQFYAQNADGEWVKFFETTCDESAKTDVKFLGMGSDYTISNVKLSTTQEAAPAIATATEYHHGDHNGMGECDFETLIDIDSTTIKINTAVANDKVVDGFWCWNSEVPEVTLNISEEVKNATNVTVEFNLKVANGNNNPNNAFGIAIAGYKGVAISLWNINDNKIDLHELTGCKLGADGWGYADTYASYGWVETLAESADGVNLRAVRDGASIQFYAQNADGEWVKFFETTCDESAKTDIKFLGMGSDYTVSNISATAANN